MNILFDLDGTLTDPYEGITKCICHALVQLDRKPPPREELRWCIGPPLKSSLAKLLGTEDDRIAKKALSIYRERFSAVGLYENEVYEGIPELLAALESSGNRIFLATSKPGLYAKRIIDHFNLGRFFSHVYGSELDGTRTDKADLISYVLEKESIAASDAVMIGDRKYDIIGAAASTVKAIGVLWGYGTQAELMESGAFDVVKNPQELVKKIRTNPH